MYRLSRIKDVLDNHDGVLELTEQLLTAMPERADILRKVEMQRIVILIMKAHQRIQRNNGALRFSPSRSAYQFSPSLAFLISS